MAEQQLAVILAGLIAGYWIVSWLMSRKWQPTKGERPSEHEENASHSSRPTAGKTWSEVLGISPAAGVDEIRHAYKKMIVEYHPDKVQTLGRELRDLAELKSKEITMAYREAMRARGVSQ